MAFESLARIDLNLLVCLHVLLEHNSVSRAAEQLNLSQSAVSKSLNRLRVLFDDPLLERDGYGMAPSPRAKELTPLLAKLLWDVEKLTAPTSFDPKESRRTFQFAAVESIYTILFPHFIQEALSMAPGLTIDTCHWASDTFERLQRGELDLAITGQDLNPAEQPKTVPKGIMSSMLYQDELCCLVNASHPAIGQEWQLDTYLSYRHIVTRFHKNERWYLDIQLAKTELSRDAAIYVPDFNSAAELCSHTDFLLTAPTLFAKHIATLLPLTILPLPLAVPKLGYTLFWHENRGNDLAHRWLKELIVIQSKHLVSAE